MKQHKIFNWALTDEEAKIEADVFLNNKTKIAKGNQVFINGKLKEV